MAIKLIEPKEPILDPQTEEQKLTNVIIYQSEMMTYEVERGNDLCEIILSLMDNNGPSNLNNAQKERINRIRINTENQKRWKQRGS